MAQFITDVFLVTARDKDLSTFILDTTLKGHDGDLWDNTWTKKAKRFIGFKRNYEDEYVVTDICVVGEDEDIPDDFVGCLITKDTREKGLRKHILCYRRDSRKTSSKGITEILLVNQSKNETSPPFFTCIGQQLSDKTIAFKLEDLPKSPPPIPDRKAVPKPSFEQRQSSMGSPTTGGIDGVPFQINPKYNTQSLMNDPVINGINLLDASEIERKYGYSFERERETLS